MKSAVAFILCGLALLAPAHAAQDEVRNESGNSSIPVSVRSDMLRHVDESISRGTKYLLAQQHPDGSFGEENTANLRVGETALVTLALLSCGESHQSKPLAAALEYLRKPHPVGRDGTYTVALRACVWASLPAPARGNNLKNDLTWLMQNQIKNGPNAGMYTYPIGPGNGGDFSNAQYGVLGVWYAANTGMEIPTAYWKRVENVWRRYQCPDGGWAYVPYGGSPYASMTAAGTATLYITNDYLHANDSQNLATLVSNGPIDRAVKWLGEHFSVDLNEGRDTSLKPKDEIDEQLDHFMGRRQREGGTFVHYMLFGYERVGEASGLTRFGTHRWFDEGAKNLLDTQADDGSWTGSISTLCDSSYALLFLSRGRSPVAVQKLELGKDGTGRWNNRPRDVANFIHFMRFAAERHMNWQIVDADARLGDLREAPILYVASDTALELSADARKNVQTYVEEGGCLVLVDEGKTDAFARSAIALCKDIWPRYSFRDLPADHPVMQNNFPMNGWTDPIRGLSNGVRELAVLFPTGDASWKWQSAMGATQVKLSPYAPLANLWLYLHGQSNPRFKGETTWVERDSAISNPGARRFVAQLKYAGNWQPEPLAWTRMENILHNIDAAELHVDVVDLSHEKIRHAYRLAHLTAAEKFDLQSGEREAIKSYIDDGGLLLFDAAGGSTEAAVSFEALMAGVFPAAKSEPLPVDHPIYTGKFAGGDAKLAITEFHYRHAAPGRLPATKLPRLRGYTLNGKLIAIESAEDLTGGMVGYPIGGITGYVPMTSGEIMRNLVLWSDAR